MRLHYCPSCCHRRLINSFWPIRIRNSYHNQLLMFLRRLALHRLCAVHVWPVQFHACGGEDDQCYSGEPLAANGWSLQSVLRHRTLSLHGEFRLSDILRAVGWPKWKTFLLFILYKYNKNGLQHPIQYIQNIKSKI